MDLDPEGIFRDDSDSDDDLVHERESTKEFSVYLVDANPKMFATAGTHEDGTGETFFNTVTKCISESLKAQIIGRLYDEIAICFFNTKEKKNIQNLNGVYAFSVADRELLDRPTASLIKAITDIEDIFMQLIGSRYWIEPASRENSLYNALWVAQALLRKGSAKNVSKRILIFTNEDDPFGNISGVPKADMIRTTLQRAKDVQELGISIELLPLSSSKGFDVSILYADLLGLQCKDVPLFLASADEKLEDMTNQLKKRMFSKRKVKTIKFDITSDVCIEVNSYALIRPSMPGKIIWLDSVTNHPLKVERTFVCADTGALIKQQRILFQEYNGEKVKFTAEELVELKTVSDDHLRLLGFKPLDCLKDYHNLRSSTFLYPTDEEIVGSTCAFIALHRSLVRLKKIAIAFYGGSSHPQLVALVAQDEIIASSGQLEPPGMHMIYLPYSDDIRYPEELQIDGSIPRVSDDQIKKASALIRRMDLKDFSVCQFSNPALQRHYGILQALALGEDEMPIIRDETLPDEEGMARPGVIRAIEEFKIAVYGENHDQEEAAKEASTSEAAKKRKAIYDVALKEYANYDWADLAENGKLKDLTVMELKSYLTAHSLPVSGKKEVLIGRILTHLGK